MSYQTPLGSATSYGVLKVGSGINVTNGVISVPPNGQINTVLVQDADSPYLVTATDEYIGVVGTIANIGIDLPTATTGRELVIKAEFGNVSNLRLFPQAGDYIEGSGSTYQVDVFAGLYPSVTLVARDGNWNIV